MYVCVLTLSVYITGLIRCDNYKDGVWSSWSQWNDCPSKTKINEPYQQCFARQDRQCVDGQYSQVVHPSFCSDNNDDGNNIKQTKLAPCHTTINPNKTCLREKLILIHILQFYVCIYRTSQIIISFKLLTSF